MVSWGKGSGRKNERMARTRKCAQSFQTSHAGRQAGINTERGKPNEHWVAADRKHEK